MWEENPRELFQGKPTQSSRDWKPNPHSAPDGKRMGAPEVKARQDATKPTYINLVWIASRCFMTGVLVHFPFLIKIHVIFFNSTLFKSTHAYYSPEDATFFERHIQRPFSKPRLRLWIRLRLAWPRGCFDILRVLCVRAQGFRREDGAWSRIQSRSRGFEKAFTKMALYSSCLRHGKIIRLQQLTVWL